jgi:hypothetical protein
MSIENRWEELSTDFLKKIGTKYRTDSQNIITPLKSRRSAKLNRKISSPHFPVRKLRMKAIPAGTAVQVIPVKIIIEEPLPMPRSEIRSDNHITTKLEETIDSMVVILKRRPCCKTSPGKFSNPIRIPVAWTREIPSANTREYLLILRLWNESFFSSLHSGITAVSNCMMILADTYGMRFSDMIDMRATEPPEILLKIPNMEELLL